MADTSICPCGAEPEHSPDAPHCTNCGGIDGQGCGECPPSLALLAERDRLQAEVERLRGAVAMLDGHAIDMGDHVTIRMDRWWAFYFAATGDDPLSRSLLASGDAR